ncbi:MAG TPA: tRNA-uridine aminocarboxypropyltransferase [Fibrobacteria bacterium]|nr:tRNA-uridine aminocarboxypropyltransferase [Fibrobacteria bacterium]
MDKASYLELKRKRLEEAVTYKKETTCYTCHWIRENCLCPLIEPFDTETRFVILMHCKEARKEKAGTGRICRATLRNSRIIVGIDFTRNEEVNALIRDPRNDCRVMYPGRKSLNVSTDDVSPLLESKRSGRRLVIFLVDGTWQCAKKMMRLSLNIRALPRIGFTAAHESIFYIKEQPAAYCLSTLESIHFFLSEADRRGVESLPGRPQDNLIVVFKSMIDFMVRCALDPSRSSYRKGKSGYSARETRKKRKPSSMRSIVLPD